LVALLVAALISYRGPGCFATIIRRQDAAEVKLNKQRQKIEGHRQSQQQGPSFSQKITTQQTVEPTNDTIPQESSACCFYCYYCEQFYEYCMELYYHYAFHRKTMSMVSLRY
jgi:hypothetical protein